MNASTVRQERGDYRKAMHIDAIRQGDAEQHTALKEFALERRRFGCRRLYAAFVYECFICSGATAPVEDAVKSLVNCITGVVVIESEPSERRL